MDQWELELQSAFRDAAAGYEARTLTPNILHCIQNFHMKFWLSQNNPAVIIRVRGAQIQNTVAKPPVRIPYVANSTR